MAGGVFFNGTLRLGVYNDAGVFTGYSDPVNATSLSISVPDPDKKVRVSNEPTSYGLALDTVSIPKSPEVQVVFNEQTPSLRALGIGGEESSYTQALGTVTPTVSVFLNKWVDLGSRNLTSATVPDQSGTGNAVENTDYLLDKTNGFIKFLTPSAYTDGDEVDISVIRKAISGTSIEGAAKASYKMRLRLDGVNLVDNKPGQYYIEKADMSASGSIDPLSGEFLVTTLKGNIEVPLSGKMYTCETDLTFS
jgi:hypothetical protein